RTREIGVRLAIGASQGAVLAMIVRESVTVAALGAAIGVPFALAAGRLTGAFLFALSPADPTALVLSACCFVGLGFLAGLPSRVSCRAHRPDRCPSLRIARGC